MSSSEIGFLLSVGGFPFPVVERVVVFVWLCVRVGAKSRASLSLNPSPLSCCEGCRFVGPPELPAEIDLRARDDSRLVEASVSEVTPKRSGCHLAYFLFASCPDTDGRVKREERLFWRATVEVRRSDSKSPLLGCCEGAVLSTREMLSVSSMADFLDSDELE